MQPAQNAHYSRIVNESLGIPVKASAILPSIVH
jgi:hypothetical protein